MVKLLVLLKQNHQVKGTSNDGPSAACDSGDQDRFQNVGFAFVVLDEFVLFGGFVATQSYSVEADLEKQCWGDTGLEGKDALMFGDDVRRMEGVSVNPFVRASGFQFALELHADFDDVYWVGDDAGSHRC